MSTPRKLIEKLQKSFQTALIEYAEETKSIPTDKQILHVLLAIASSAADNMGYPFAPVLAAHLTYASDFNRADAHTLVDTAFDLSQTNKVKSKSLDN